jgi:hypothetical protein
MKKNTNKKEGPKIDIIALDFFFLKKKNHKRRQKLDICLVK